MALRLLAKHIIAHLGNKEHISTHTHSSHRLIGALTSGSHHKRATDDRFARLGHTLGFDYKVGVGTSYHYYFSHNVFTVFEFFHCIYLAENGLVGVIVEKMWIRRAILFEKKRKK